MYDSEPAYCGVVVGCTDTAELSGVSVLALSCISCDNIPQMSSISVFWQIPQFTLIGISQYCLGTRLVQAQG